MAKMASERRLQKRATNLSALYANHPDRFHFVWNRLYKGWVNEVHFRTRQQCSNSSPDAIPAIFDVMKQAHALASASGAVRDPKIESSLMHLQHLCAKSVAEVTDRRLYQFESDCTTRLRERFVRNRARD